MGMDILSENFTRKQMIVYGIVVPTALIVVCLIVGK